MKDLGKRVLSFLVVMVMLFTMIPAYAFADEGAHNHESE